MSSRCATSRPSRARATTSASGRFARSRARGTAAWKKPRAMDPRCAAAGKYAPPAAQSSCALVSRFHAGDLSRMPGTLEEHRVEAAAEGSAEKREFVRATFEQIAPRYDLLNHLLSFNIDRRWRKRALRALEWTHAPAGRYLDLCAGTLDVSALLAAQRDFAGFVLGADFAEPMLRAGT